MGETIKCTNVYTLLYKRKLRYLSHPCTQGRHTHRAMSQFPTFHTNIEIEDTDDKDLFLGNSTPKA
jgi:hypothetical protein